MTPFSVLPGILAASIISVPVPPGVPSADVTAHHGAVYQTRQSGQPTMGFMSIDNTGRADSLTGATCPLADTTILVDANNKPISAIAIPTRQSLSLSPAGPHLLLQSTHYSVQYGAVIPCSLIFANAGTISIFLYARPAPDGT